MRPNAVIGVGGEGFIDTTFSRPDVRNIVNATTGLDRMTVLATIGNREKADTDKDDYIKASTLAQVNSNNSRLPVYYA